MQVPADASVRQQVRALIEERERLAQQLSELRRKHAPVFEALEALEDDAAQCENVIKDTIRQTYKEGDARGIYDWADSPHFHVSATVKYAKDSVDPQALRARYPGLDLRRLGVIVAEEKVDLDHLKQAIADGELDAQALKLQRPGKFMTPSVTIKVKG